MGDEGRLYVAEDLVAAYRSLLPHADLILPNAFEAELLSEIKITDMDSLMAAITKLHMRYQIPHIIVTSLRISTKSGRRMSNTETDTLIVVGSSCRKGKDLVNELEFLRIANNPARPQPSAFLHKMSFTSCLLLWHWRHVCGSDALSSA